MKKALQMTQFQSGPAKLKCRPQCCIESIELVHFKGFGGLKLKKLVQIFLTERESYIILLVKEKGLMKVFKIGYVIS